MVSLCLVLLLLAFFGNLLVYVRLRGRPVRRVLGACLKGISFVVVALLLWLIFVHETHPEDDDGAQKRTISLLRDRSASMELRADGTVSRTVVADRIERLLEKAVEEDDEGGTIEIRHFEYGGNVVRSGSGKSVDPEHSRVSQAVDAVSGRMGAGAVLVVSDGCFASGQSGGALRRQAENRGVSVYSVGTFESDRAWNEIILGDLDLAALNPESVSVPLMVGLGAVGREVEMICLVDSRKVCAKRVVLADRKTVTLLLGVQDPGWHLLTVTTPALVGELCQENNTRNVMFRTTGRKKVVLLYGRPTRETVQLARNLRTQFGSRLQVLPESEAAIAEVSGTDVAMFVVGDVRPDRLSKSLLSALASPRARRIMLPSSLMFSWPFSLPVIGGSDGVKAQRLSLALQIPGGVRLPTLELLGELRAPVRRLAVVRPRLGAVALLEAVGGNMALPFVVSDDRYEPRTLVVLGDSTWRWSMSPNASIRACYAAVWQHLISLLSGKGSEELDLELALSSLPSTDVTITVRPPPSIADPRTLHVEVELAQGGGTASRQALIFDISRGCFTGSAGYTVPGVVLWVRAMGCGDGQTCRSERKPVFREAFRSEHAVTVPSISAVRGIATDSALGASAMEGAKEVVGKLLQELPEPPPPVRKRERSFRLEMVLAGLLVVLLGIEWGVERLLPTRDARKRKGRMKEP
ncbi:MAG: hypothetical protein KAI66_22720 [Lentisphaeria bacterium]|nr:hypothetical protein [Lentisphaeria bacterium]